MNAKNMAVAIAFLVMVLGVTTVTYSQDTNQSVVNFVFEQEAIAVESPVAQVIGQVVNIRSVPSTDVSRPLDSLQRGTIVVPVYQSNTGWILVRAYSESGIYQLSGWINVEAAALAPLSDTTTETIRLTANECLLADGSVQRDINVRLNGVWFVDPQSTKCNLVCEGRTALMEEFHNLWIFRDVLSGTMDTNDLRWVENEKLLTDGVFLGMGEGTCWEYPVFWNIGDSAHREFTCGKQYEPAACALASDKFGAMAQQDPPYAWDVHVHLMNGEEIVLPYGSLEPAAVDRCDFSEPKEMNITGAFDATNGVFISTSLGALGCRSVVLWQLPDRSFQLLSFVGARERLAYYRDYSAVLVPSSWTDSQLNDEIMLTLVNAQADGFIVNGATFSGVLGFEEGEFVSLTVAEVEPSNETETDSD